MQKQKLTLEQALAHVVGLHEAGRLPESLQLARQVAGAAPQNAMAQNVLSAAAEANGQFDEAIEAAMAATRLAPDFVDAFFNLGTAHQKLGHFNDALEAFARAQTLAQDDFDILFNSGLCLRELDRLEEACSSFDKALGMQPGHAEARLALAMCLSHMNENARAVSVLREGIASQPDNQRFWSLLLDTRRRSNDLDGMREDLAAASKALGEDHIVSAMAKAWIARENGELETARDCLQTIAEPEGAGLDLAIAHAEQLGKVHDSLNEPAAAFAQFQRLNRLSLRRAPNAERQRTAYLARLDELEQTFTPEWTAGWSENGGRFRDEEPVFLVGFPRSGTTLLDTILRSHSKISVIEEQPILHRVIGATCGLPGGAINGLANLDADQLTELQQLYLDTLASYDPAQGKSERVINKMPLNLLEAGLVARLFPKAKWLVALRHPCDCVLSCFMQQFDLNASMANFTDLELAASFYDRAFRLWERYQQAVPLQVHQLRYEDLIADLDGTVAAVLDFLSLEWEDAVRDYVSTAQARARINTPSFAQVVKPLYTSSRGRWQKYHEQMAPALPVLLPWARKHGYET